VQALVSSVVPDEVGGGRAAVEIGRRLARLWRDRSFRRDVRMLRLLGYGLSPR